MEHLILRTYPTQDLILRTYRMQPLILRTQSDARLPLLDMGEASPLCHFLTLLTLVTIDFILSNNSIYYDSTIVLLVIY